MSSAITETPGTWPTSVTAPDGTDVVSITAVRSAMEDINDRVLRTRQSLGMAIVAGSGTSTTRRVPLMGSWDPDNWEPAWLLGIGGLVQGVLVDNYEVLIPLPPGLVPDGATITAISCWVDPPAGHGGVNPTNMPSLRLVRSTATSTTYSTIGTATDATVAGSYETAHAVTLSGLTEVVDHSTYSYAMMFRGEEGGSAQTGLIFHPGTVTYTPPV